MNRRLVYVIGILLIVIVGVSLVMGNFAFHNEGGLAQDGGMPVPTLVPRVSLVVTAPPSTYHVVDDVFSPSGKKALTQVELLQASSDYNGHSWQKVVVRNPKNGSEHDVFERMVDGMVFEKILPTNWSASNRFVFVLVNDHGKQDVVFFQTDGRFTNTRYYVQPMSLYPDVSVVHVSWVGSTRAAVDTVNMKTHDAEKFVIDFPDSNVIVMPAAEASQLSE